MVIFSQVWGVAIFYEVVSEEWRHFPVFFPSVLSTVGLKTWRKNDDIDRWMHSSGYWTSKRTHGSANDCCHMWIWFWKFFPFLSFQPDIFIYCTCARDLIGFFFFALLRPGVSVVRFSRFPLLNSPCFSYRRFFPWICAGEKNSEVPRLFVSWQEHRSADVARSKSESKSICR